jgi:hypothetical protein
MNENRLSLSPEVAHKQAQVFDVVPSNCWVTVKVLVTDNVGVGVSLVDKQFIVPELRARSHSKLRTLVEM